MLTGNSKYKHNGKEQVVKKIPVIVNGEIIINHKVVNSDSKMASDSDSDSVNGTNTKNKKRGFLRIKSTICHQTLQRNTTLYYYCR